ncbi:hypothetical protein N9V96_01135 [Polaribacter sp.]|nr:hypothetical protein [Polaribacter sp.]
MKRLTKLLMLFFFIGLMSFTKDNCASFLKNKKFTYRVKKEDVLIVFKKNQYVEYHENKKYFIKSDIEWISSCEYNLIIKETTLPNFPFKMGTKMHIIIEKIKGNKVYYTGTLGGRSWEGRMTRYFKK